MGLREGLNPLVAGWGEAQPNDPLVVFIVDTLDKPCADGPVDQLNSAVVA